MKKYCLVFLVLFIVGSSFAGKVNSAERQIFKAKVVGVEGVVEQEGLKMQEVRVEISEGENKGTTIELMVPYEEVFVRQLQTGDEVRVNASDINGDQYYQFFDFVRTNNYIWLLLLFLVFLVAFVGLKGIRTLVPAALLILALAVGVIPFSASLFNSVLLSIFIIAIVAALTAWIRMRRKLPIPIVTVSVVLSLLVGFFVFLGFSQASYIVPFIGSVTTVDETLYLDIIDVTIVSILFIPAGGVLNAGVQVSKYIMEEFVGKQNISLKEMLKQGFRVSQKISAGEFNNLLIIMLGTSITGIFLIKEQYPQIPFWDNGWVALHIIYTISAGISLLLITPITVLASAAAMEWAKSRGRGRVAGGQRRLTAASRRK